MTASRSRRGSGRTTAGTQDIERGARQRGRRSGFDFEGTYSELVPHRRIAYVMADGREVVVEFVDEGGAVHVREAFDPETTHPVEMQRQAWQAILDRFARHVEAHPPA